MVFRDARCFVLPQLLALLFVAGLVFYLRQPIRDAMSRVTGIEVYSLRFELDELDAAAIREAAQSTSIPIEYEELQSAYDRARRLAHVYVGANILWVDDVPENNVWERRVFRSLGANVDAVLNDGETRDQLRRSEYDLVLTDFGRPGDDVQGLIKDVLSPMGPYGRAPSVIIYTLNFDPQRRPAGIFGVTEARDELLDLVTEALHRRRG